MSKSTHFTGQPIFTQIVRLLWRDRVIELSRNSGGERYVKRFDGWTHLMTMLFAVIMRFDSLREITGSLQIQAQKLNHLGFKMMPSRSTLADANSRRPEAFFGAVYHDLYTRYRHVLSSDSRPGRRHEGRKWLKTLQIIDSTTISLFSTLIFKGVGRHPKAGKKKGGIKVHTMIHANEGVPSDIQFTSAATHDAFMLKPDALKRGDIIAMDRAYIDYAKFEAMTSEGIVYVTKMKKNLRYTVESDIFYQTSDGVSEIEVKHVVFTKQVKEKDPVIHRARIIIYADVKKDVKLTSLLTNDMEMDPEEIVEIYRRRWQIELLFKQLKQNFPLKYFYGESANAIKIQIWVTLIANLLIMIHKRWLTRSWSFSGLVTMLRITLMSYYDFFSLFNHPEKDWERALAKETESPPRPSLFD